MYKQLLDKISIERTGKEFDANEHITENTVGSKGIAFFNDII